MHRETVNSIIMIISMFFLLLYFSAIQIVHNDMVIKSLAARNKELDILARTDQLTGDDVLKELSRRLHVFVPPDNPIVRWGGEEFMIITKLALSAATKMAEKIRRSFEPTKWTADHMSMSASFGVAEVKDSEPSTTWLIRLERVLYEAKNSGRNRVVNPNHQ